MRNCDRIGRTLVIRSQDLFVEDIVTERPLRVASLVHQRFSNIPPEELPVENSVSAVTWSPPLGSRFDELLLRLGELNRLEEVLVFPGDLAVVGNVRPVWRVLFDDVQVERLFQGSSSAGNAYAARDEIGGSGMA